MSIKAYMAWQNHYLSFGAFTLDLQYTKRRVSVANMRPRNKILYNLIRGPVTYPLTDHLKALFFLFVFLSLQINHDHGFLFQPSESVHSNQY